MSFEDWYKEWEDLLRCNWNTAREVYDGAYKQGWTDGTEYSTNGPFRDGNHF